MGGGGSDFHSMVEGGSGIRMCDGGRSRVGSFLGVNVAVM